MKKSLIKRAAALALSLIMVIGLMPTIPGAVAATTTDLVYSNKVSDPSSFDNWKDYYGLNSLLPDGSRGVSTWKAGGVWTDKSVYSDSASFPNSITMQNQDNNFLVALSALASNKEIVGQSSTPTDTMLILDLSQSMDNSGSVDDMIAAANDSIDALLKMNVNNRVGVVLYSGNTSTSRPAYTNSATVILPLDRYSTTGNEYLTVSGTNDTTVSVAQGTLNSDNQRPTGSKNTAGGTYIQNGLYQAWQEFESMTDKGVVQSGAQAGTQRQPIFILMSDGRPTLATEEYNNVGTSDSSFGNGTENSTQWETVFLTQLTASYAKGAVEDYYNTEALFYTIGLSTGNDTYATAVLNPQGTAENSDLTTWWNNFISDDRLSDDGQSVLIKDADRWGRNAWELAYEQCVENIGRYYADGYWASSNVNDMISKFQEIIAEIGLQSAASATLIESGNADMDGYITVQDELGVMMQVKDVKGILIGDTLFSGAEIAKSMNEGLLGSSSNPKSYGDAFVQTVKERIGITDTSVAQNLIRSAYHNGQLYYDEATGEFSNYIGWYGDENNGYLGFWQESDGYDSDGAPDGAKYINQSYGYLGGSAGTDGVEDMMHIVVMVRTNIETSHQTILFKIPSSLIPMVEYKVELDGDSLENANEITLSVTEADPIRLVYEVGLPEGINNINIAQKVAEFEQATGLKVHQKNGTYQFYANSWDKDNDGVAPDITSMNDSERNEIKEFLPESHFIPNTSNERFYIQEDSVVYYKDGNEYKPVTTSIDNNGTYYFARPIIIADKDSTNAQIVTQYEQLQSATVANADNFQYNNGQWEIKAGTIRQQLSNVILSKSDNVTETIANTDQLWVNVTSGNPADFNIYSFLGNNGRLTVTPATGIKVTKSVAEYAQGDNADTSFEIAVTLNKAENNAVVTDADGNPLDNSKWSTSDNKTFILKLKHGESAYITGLTAGNTYTVTENTSAYMYSYSGATETEAGKIVEGTLTNTGIKPGNLYITKEVVNIHGGTAFPTDYEFEFEVTFTDADGKAITNTTFQLENNYDSDLTKLTTDGNGVMRGKLRHGETVYIMDIPAGTTVSVEEVNIPQNYEQTPDYRSRNQSGAVHDNDGTVVIQPEHNATVVVTNTYVPSSVDVNISFEGTKNFDATSMDVDSEFTFKLQEYKNGAWADIDDAKVTVLKNTDATEAFSFDTLALSFSEPGTHSYRIIEEEKTNKDITYDRSVYSFSVNVTLDSNGDLQAEVIGGDYVSGDAANGYTVNSVFTNEYHTTATSIEIKKSVIDNSNSGKTPGGFIIETYNADSNWNYSASDKIRDTVTNAQGEALLVRNYDNSDFDSATDTQKVYHFVIKEKASGAAGWEYDATEYRVTVTLNRDAVTQEITADFSVVKVEKDGTTTDLSISGDTAVISFTNTYNPEDAVIDLNLVPTVKKELSGRNLKAGEFKFAIFENGKSSFTDTTNAIMIGTNDADGNISFVANGKSNFVNAENKFVFDKVGKYEFDIVEITGSLGGVTYDATIYDMVVEVTDDDGKLKEEYYFEDSVSKQVIFKNTYTATSVNTVIEGRKTLQVNSGYKSLNAGDYTFELYNTDADGNATGQPVATAKNLANGTFKFDAIEFGMADVGKTYTYVVKEQIPENADQNVLNGVKYSAAIFTVKVTVVDNEDGTLSANVIGNGTDNINFVNTYESEKVNVKLNGTKQLLNRDLTENEFKFALYASNSSFTTRTLIDDTITHNANGEFEIALGELDMGSYYYIVKEVIPGERAVGIHYDANEYFVTVQVTDSGNGKMEAIVSTKHSGNPSAINPDILFKNIYEPLPGDLVISGTKTYNGGKALEDDVFSVGLYEGGNQIGIANIKSDGSFAFDSIEYTASDVGKTFTYTVKEIIPDGAVDNRFGNDIYDATVYTLEVKITDDKNGELEIAKTLTKNGASADVLAFENTFVPTPVEHTIQAKKTYEKGLKGGDFRFNLVSADNKTSVNQTKENDVNGDIVFDAISFSAAGEYKFKLVEKKDNILSFILPSQAEYEITITVVNENGILRISNVESINTKNTNETNLEFINTYVIDGEDEITLRGTKTLTGDRTEFGEGAFEFGLYDADGKLVEAVKNDAAGSFTFATLTFDETDVPVNGEKEITYTVKEIAGNNARYDYDDTVYTVVVTVKDNDQGRVTATYTVNGTENGAIGFTNIYTNPTPVTYTPMAQKNYNRTLDGGEFKFKLEGEIAGTAVSQEKTNAAGGTITFDTLSFPEAGVYTFTVKEIDKVLGFIEYSTAEYELVVNIVDTNGVLSLGDVTVNGDEDGTIEFTNTYVIDGEDEITLRGTKTLTGDRTEFGEGAFEFGLYDADGKLVEAVKNDAAGSFAFATLTFDETDVPVNGEKEITYTVKEIAGNNARYDYDDTVYTVVVTVKDNDQGRVTATYTVNGTENGAIGFTNIYTNPTPVTYTPMAQKNYNRTLDGGEFKFKLEGEIAGTAVSQEKTNAAGGTVTFDTLSFPEAGVYTFTVKEIDKVLGFIEYSTAEYELVVNIVDTNGVLSLGDVTVNGDEDGTIEFTNTYVIDGEDEITLRGNKVLTGGRTSVNAGEFEFGLYDAGGKLIESVKNDADGNFAFTTLKFDEADVPVSGQKQITYTVKEIKGTDIRVTYDETVYTVVVTVKDNEQGGVTASYTVNSDATGLIAFTNIYTPKSEDITIDLDIVKTVVNKGSDKISPEGFEFLLNNLTDGVADVTVKADENGKAKFTLTFTEDDIGKTYTYKLTEVNSGKANVTYSAAEYTITASIERNVNNELVATLTKNGENVTKVVAEFENVYDYTPVPPNPEYPDIPDTGDNSNSGMWVALLFISGGAVVVLTVVGRKKRYMPKH